MVELNTYLKQILFKEGVHEWTDIQKQSLPHSLNGEDILAEAPAGSGKTYAYLLPILQNIKSQGKGKHLPVACILAPTRELSVQISRVCRTLLAGKEGIRTAVLTGGIDIQKQIRTFSKGADIVIGTPSRICDHIRRHTLKLKECSYFILDEADEMLSMGFREDVLNVMNHLPNQHQTMFFSATWNKEVETFAYSFLHEPFECHIQKDTVLKQQLKCTKYILPANKKLTTLLKVIHNFHTKTVVFTNRKKTADFVSDFLNQNHLKSCSIHSDMNYKERTQYMSEFRTGQHQILCATGVAERGIDIPDVELVILYDLPDTQEELIHRTARTGRANHIGHAIVFTLPYEQKKYNLDTMFNSMQTVQISSTEYKNLQSNIYKSKKPHSHSNPKSKKNYKR